MTPATLGLLLCAVASASPLGGALPDPNRGHLGLGATLDTGTSLVTDPACTGDSGCEAHRAPFLLGGRVDLVLLRGLGVYAELGHVAESIEEAGYRGSGVAHGLGVKAAVPLGGPFLAGLAFQYEKGKGESLTSTPTTSAWTLARGVFSAILASPDHGAQAWLGPTWRVLANQDLDFGGEDGAFELTARRPLGAILGGQVDSEALGAPWGSVRSYLFAGLETRWEDGFAIAAWTGLRF